MNYYEIFDRETGRLLAKGNARECRKALGCSSMDTFYALANRSRRGKNQKYTVNIIEGGLADYPVLGKQDPEWNKNGIKKVRNTENAGKSNY